MTGQSPSRLWEPVGHDLFSTLGRLYGRGVELEELFAVKGSIVLLCQVGMKISAQTTRGSSRVEAQQPAPYERGLALATTAMHVGSIVGPKESLVFVSPRHAPPLFVALDDGVSVLGTCGQRGDAPAVGPYLCPSLPDV